MEGLGILILGVLVAVSLLLLFVVLPKLRPYAIAALVSPIAAGIVLILGAFILADMNPANEYGSENVQNGSERDPTKIHAALWLLSVAATLAGSAWLCIRLQPVAIDIVQSLWKRHQPTRIDLQ